MMTTAIDRNKLHAIRRVVDELLQRFDASENGEIVLNMKKDGVNLTIVPDYMSTVERKAKNACGFNVYTYVKQGKAALPFMSCTDIRTLARNLIDYDGIRFDKLSDDGAFNYYIMIIPSEEDFDEDELAYEAYLRDTKERMQKR